MHCRPVFIETVRHSVRERVVIDSFPSQSRFAPRAPCVHGLTGQPLLPAVRNPNECNWSTARKKIGPVNHPCDRLIDVISIASLFFFGDVTISRSTEETSCSFSSVPCPPAVTFACAVPTGPSKWQYIR
jgi:hypothetical protein